MYKSRMKWWHRFPFTVEAARSFNAANFHTNLFKLDHFADQDTGNCLGHWSSYLSSNLFRNLAGHLQMRLNYRQRFARERLNVRIVAFVGLRLKFLNVFVMVLYHVRHVFLIE